MFPQSKASTELPKSEKYGGCHLATGWNAASRYPTPRLFSNLYTQHAAVSPVTPEMLAPQSAYREYRVQFKRSVDL
jgi:hypothetical protein